MPPKSQNGKKEGKKSGSAKAGPPASSPNALKSLLSTEMKPIISNRSNLPPATVEPFTLASWNVLADDHVYPHYYPQLSKPQLAWNVRLPLLLDRVRTLNPDILCMQEVDQWKDWDTGLKSHGYTNAYLPRGGSKQDGCSISFKTDRFMQLDRFEIRMDDIAGFPFPNTERIRKHCVALALVLRPLNIPPNVSEDLFDFCVVTTHIFWNPKFEDVKLRQAIYLMYQLQQLWPHKDRLILCGDFNSTPDSALATFVRTGSVDIRSWDPKVIVGRGGYHGQCKDLDSFGLTPGAQPQAIEPIDQSSPLDHDSLFRLLKCPVMSHPFRFESVYSLQISSDQSNVASSSNAASSSSAPSSSSSSQSNAKSKRPTSGNTEPITSHFQQFSGTLDYIFTSPGVHATSLLSVPTNDEIKELGWLPNTSFASDHIILMAQLQLSTKKKT